jgi:hypothetical protein
VVIKKKPVKELPVGYVPPGGEKINVSNPGPLGAWNWARVATHYKLPDVWADLILFNFPTVAYETSFRNKCAAVNWYLEERVGCVNSADGQNYSFAGATIGDIYVPKVVTNDVGRRAFKSVMSVLGSPYLHYLNFVLDDVFIHPTFFHKVGTAILDGKIGISVNPPGMDPGSEAEYAFTASPPMFRLRHADMLSAHQKSNIVHEAVHAISHLKGRDRDILLDEAVAHLAQAIFHRKLTGRRVTNGVPGSVKDDAYKAADDVAQLVLKSRLLGEPESLSIRKALAPLYGLGTYRYSGYPMPK